MTKLNVLFVDDNINLLQGVRRALRNEPFNIITATSAAEALKIIGRNNISIICTDQRMPGTNGLRLLEMVRESHPEIVRIMLTGYATVGMAMSAINKGEVFRLLTKPFDTHELSVTLKDASLLNHPNEESSAESSRKDELSSLEAEFPGISKLRVNADGVILADTE